MDSRIKNFCSNLHDKKGDNHIIFLDTGAIIDIETWVRRYRIKDKSHDINMWYNGIRADKKILVTPQILGEVRDHHYHHKINGRPEISRESYDLAQKFYQEYLKFKKECKCSVHDIEQIRYDAYWATKLTFEGDEKKEVIDPMSNADIELIVNSVAAKHLCSTKDNPVTGMTILSSDRHIHDTIKMLRGEHDKYDRSYTGFNYQGIHSLCLRK